ncbi:molecular chaperone Tir [Leuconostoc mesenteroides P45]|uniref:TIR domain-containing protein n=1 Tax=Leuconostoc mesenteroides TaxID=1245 RepID=UPI0005056E4E|nr:TIR domain-containing protein [Leuconostoc mesenteroides]KGB50926.1 molecular chaperone Tir [Leuconostoc mesenteroides P45]
MAYRNKVYVAFDGDNDIFKYDLIKAWSKNQNIDFHIDDAHDLNTSKDSSQEASIKHNLSIRFSNSKAFILLVGEHTKNLTKFVKWEIETAIRLELPIIAVNLNGKKRADELMPPLLKENLSIVVPFKMVAIKYALENWPESDKEYRKNQDHRQYHYNDKVYDSLGI